MFSSRSFNDEIVSLSLSQQVCEVKKAPSTLDYLHTVILPNNPHKRSRSNAPHRQHFGDVKRFKNKIKPHKKQPASRWRCLRQSIVDALIIIDSCNLTECLLDRREKRQRASKTYEANWQFFLKENWSVERMTRPFLPSKAPKVTGRTFRCNCSAVRVEHRLNQLLVQHQRATYNSNPSRWGNCSIDFPSFLAILTLQLRTYYGYEQTSNPPSLRQSRDNVHDAVGKTDKYTGSDASQVHSGGANLHAEMNARPMILPCRRLKKLMSIHVENVTTERGIFIKARTSTRAPLAPRERVNPFSFSISLSWSFVKFREVSCLFCLLHHGRGNNTAALLPFNFAALHTLKHKEATTKHQSLLAVQFVQNQCRRAGSSLERATDSLLALTLEITTHTQPITNGANRKEKRNAFDKGNTGNKKRVYAVTWEHAALSWTFALNSEAHTL